MSMRELYYIFIRYGACLELVKETAILKRENFGEKVINMLSGKYLFEDVDLNDYKIRSETVALIAKSHGNDIFGRAFLPAVKDNDERTPVVIFFHGYPGTEQNLDIPHALRRVGIASVHFSYRGVWGSHGDYSFTHLIEDAHAILEYLTGKANEWRLDMKRVYLVGHSMGGFAVLNALAEGIAVKGAVVLAPCDMGEIYINEPRKFEQMMQNKKKGYFVLLDDNSIEEDTRLHAEQWSFVNLADKLAKRVPIHFVGGTRDKVTPPDIHITPLYQKLLNLGSKTSYTEFDDGHAFPDHRIALTQLVFQKISEMEKEQA